MHEVRVPPHLAFEHLRGAGAQTGGGRDGALQLRPDHVDVLVEELGVALQVARHVLVALVGAAVKHPRVADVLEDLHPFAGALHHCPLLVRAVDHRDALERRAAVLSHDLVGIDERFLRDEEDVDVAVHARSRRLCQTKADADVSLRASRAEEDGSKAD